MRVATEGAGRFDHLHGDEDQVLDVESFEKRALADVVETIMLFGQWPQPHWDKTKPARRVAFDLNEFLADEYDASDLARIAVAALTLNGVEWMDFHSDEQKKLEAKITEHLRDSQIVRDHAEHLAEEDRWDRS